MSIKNLSSAQIQNDIDVMNRTWPGGVPMENTDQMKALVGELKRRGVEVQKTAPASGPAIPASLRTIESMRTELASLYDKIQNDPQNEGLQEQYANVRYEIKNREKELSKADAPPASPTVIPRDIEIPEMQADAGPPSAVSTYSTPEGAAFAARIDGVKEAFSVPGVLAAISSFDVGGPATTADGRVLVMTHVTSMNNNSAARFSVTMDRETTLALIAKLQDKARAAGWLP